MTGISILPHSLEFVISAIISVHRKLPLQSVHIAQNRPQCSVSKACRSWPLSFRSRTLAASRPKKKALATAPLTSTWDKNTWGETNHREFHSARKSGQRYSDNQSTRLGVCWEQGDQKRIEDLFSTRFFPSAFSEEVEAIFRLHMQLPKKILSGALILGYLSVGIVVTHDDVELFDGRVGAEHFSIGGSQSKRELQLLIMRASSCWSLFDRWTWAELPRTWGLRSSAQSPQSRCAQSLTRRLPGVTDWLTHQACVCSPSSFTATSTFDENMNTAYGVDRTLMYIHQLSQAFSFAKGVVGGLSLFSEGSWGLPFFPYNEKKGFTSLGLRLASSLVPGLVAKIFDTKEIEKIKI